jgi:hypothetical protein
MGDIIDINAAQTVKLVGADATGLEQTPISSTTLGDLTVTDVPNQVGINTTLNLTTTAAEGKVGASTLVNRKYVEMQALTNNVKWGYDSTCPFDLFKGQFFSLPAGNTCKVYFKASTGTAQVAFAEK